MKKWCIWLSNVDSSKSRKEGRKIAKGLSIKNPSLEELFEASKNLGLNPEIDKSFYPKEQGKEEKKMGRIFVEKKYSKTKTLKLICDEVRKNRS